MVFTATLDSLEDWQESSGVRMQKVYCLPLIKRAVLRCGWIIQL